MLIILSLMSAGISYRHRTSYHILCCVSWAFPELGVPSAHLRVACHDGVVAVIIQRGCSCVKGAGAIGFTADPVVLASLRDLLAIFEPVDLLRKTRKN